MDVISCSVFKRRGPSVCCHFGASAMVLRTRSGLWRRARMVEEECELAGRTNSERGQAALQSKPQLPELGSCWPLVIAFIVPDGAAVFHCLLTGEGHFHTICSGCFLSDANYCASHASPRSRRSVFYGCEDCNLCRVLNVLSKSLQGFCREPIRCAYCQDFVPLIHCKRCAQLREEVREGRVKDHRPILGR